MSDNDWRNARIEEAAKAIYENERRTIDPGWPAWEYCRDGSKESVLDAARDAFAVFEKALGEATVTPTDDEREALRIAHLDARQAAYRKEREDWFVDHEAEPEIASNAFFRGWDAAVGGGFRRTEVPEPSAEPTCEHGTTLTELCEHVERLVNEEPQGEPSDTEISARVDAFYDRRDMSAGDWAKATFAALRAASAVTEAECGYCGRPEREHPGGAYCPSWPAVTEQGRICGPCSRGQHAACDGPNEFWGDCTCSCKEAENR